MARIRIRPSIIVDVEYPGGRKRRYRGRNLFTDYGLWLLMFWAFGECQTSPDPQGSGGWNTNWSGGNFAYLGPFTRYNDGVNVYPSPWDLNTNGSTGPANNIGSGGTNSGLTLRVISGIQTTNSPWQFSINASGLSASTNYPLQSFGLLPGLGAILVATSDSTPVSETQMVWPSGTTCLWANSDSGVSVSTATTWTLTGSTTSPTPPVATWVFQDINTASTAISIQSFGWTVPWVVGSVSSGAAPVQQARPSSVYTSGSGTNLVNWPIISKVIPSGAPISVPAGGKLTVTYTFTLTN
jgi:hypothetical protein